MDLGGKDEIFTYHSPKIRPKILNKMYRKKMLKELSEREGGDDISMFKVRTKSNSKEGNSFKKREDRKTGDKLKTETVGELKLTREDFADGLKDITMTQIQLNLQDINVLTPSNSPQIRNSGCNNELVKKQNLLLDDINVDLLDIKKINPARDSFTPEQDSSIDYTMGNRKFGFHILPHKDTPFKNYKEARFDRSKRLSQIFRPQQDKKSKFKRESKSHSLKSMENEMSNEIVSKKEQSQDKRQSMSKLSQNKISLQSICFLSMDTRLKASNTERLPVNITNENKGKLMRSLSLKDSIKELDMVDMSFMREDSCELQSNISINEHCEKIYYGDNKFVQTKNTFSVKETNPHKRQSLCKNDKVGFKSILSNKLPQNLNQTNEKINFLDCSSINFDKKNINQSKDKEVVMNVKNIFNDLYKANDQSINTNKHENELNNMIDFDDSHNFSMEMKNSKQLFSLEGFKLDNLNLKEGFSLKSSPSNRLGKSLFNESDLSNFYQENQSKNILNGDGSFCRDSDETSIFKKNYEVLDHLGTGNFGSVYMCRNKFDKLIYAVKVLKQSKKKAMNEAQALASLNLMYESTYIVRYFTSWEERKNVYIVMEMCNKNLEQLCRENQKINEQTLRKIIKHICKALSKLHKDNVVHLDIKPENILMSNSGKFKISDLGLVKLLKNENDVKTLSEGDSRYMAKELLNDYTFADIESKSVDLTKVDIFSLGITILGMMAKDKLILPKNGDLWRQLRNNNLSMLQSLGNYSNSFKRLIMMMMDKDPSKRPSAKDILEKDLLYNKQSKIDLLNEKLKAMQKQIADLESNQLDRAQCDFD